MGYPELGHFGFKLVCSIFMFTTFQYQMANIAYKQEKLKYLSKLEPKHLA
jgi:hypothetical protein